MPISDAMFDVKIDISTARERKKMAHPVSVIATTASPMGSSAATIDPNATTRITSRSGNASRSASWASRCAVSSTAALRPASPIR